MEVVVLCLWLYVVPVELLLLLHVKVATGADISRRCRVGLGSKSRNLLVSNNFAILGDI